MLLSNKASASEYVHLKIVEDSIASGWQVWACIEYCRISKLLYKCVSDMALSKFSLACSWLERFGNHNKTLSMKINCRTNIY